MLRILLAVALALMSQHAMSCSNPPPKSFHERIQTADNVYIFRLETLAQVKERVSYSERGSDGKFGPVEDSDEYMGLAAGRIRVVRVLRGTPHARFIKFSTRECGGLRLDVGHYFLVATTDNGTVLSPVASDRAIIDLRDSYSEQVDRKVNDKQNILRTVLGFINGRRLPADFPTIEMLQYTQSGSTPPPPPGYLR